MPPQIEVLGVLDLSVQGSLGVQSVPSLNAFGLGIVFVLFLLLGVWGCV